MIFPFVLYAVLVLLILPLPPFRYYGALTMVALIVALATDAKAADPGFCELWARQNVELNIADPQDPISEGATAALIEQMEIESYESCLLTQGQPRLRASPANTSAAWAERMARLVKVPAGTAPASGEGWAEACAAEWRSFDPSDGTVVRPRSKGGKQRCPLVMVDGEWRIPE